MARKRRSKYAPGYGEASGGETLEGLADVAASMGSGMLVEPAAGLTGLAMLAYSGGDLGAATEAIESTQRRFTWGPKTAVGQDMLQDVGEFMAPLEEGREWMGEKNMDAMPDWAPEWMKATAGTVGHILPEIVGTMLGAGPAVRMGGRASKLLDDIPEVVQPRGPGKYQGGSFGGNRAKSADPENFKKAESMKRQGDTPESIKKETGLEEHEPGVWKTTIPDVGFSFGKSAPKVAKLKAHMKSRKDAIGTIDPDKWGAYDAKWKKELNRITDYDIGNTKVGSLIEHDRLLSEYPHLKDIDIQFDPRMQRSYASYEPARLDSPERIKVNPQAKDYRSSINHELVHAVDQFEGAASGSNAMMASAMQNRMVMDLDTAIAKGRSTPEYKKAQEDSSYELLGDRKFMELSALERSKVRRDAKEWADAETGVSGLLDERKKMEGADEFEIYERDWGEGRARASQASLEQADIMGTAGMSQDAIAQIVKDADTPFDKPRSEFIETHKILNDDSIDSTSMQAKHTAAPKKVLHRNRKSGQYYGAPKGVNSPQALGKIRKDYEQAVDTGASGADWYHDSSKFIDEVTNDPTRAQQVADVLAVTSARTPVDANLGHTIKGVNQKLAGAPISTGGFPSKMQPLITDILEGNKPALGFKRDPFAQNLSVNWDPEKGVRPVHDIWDARAWGFKGKNGKPFNQGLSETQHAWADDQAMLLDERMNKKKVGGREDWNPLRSQAAAWTGAKIAAGDLKKEDAAKHFGSYQDKYTANATHEQVPGAGTGHLEGIVDMPESVRRAYSNDPNVSWTEEGRDKLYSGSGLMTGQSREGSGMYTPQTTGVTEFNPMEVASPMVSREERKIPFINKKGKPDKKSTGDVSLGQWDKDILDATEGLRAYIDVQNAGAWHSVIPGNKPQYQTGAHIPIEGKVRQNTLDELNALAQEQGMFASDTGGRGVNLINDPYSKPGAARVGEGVKFGKDLRGQFGKDIKGIAGVKPERTRVESGYLDYEDAWQKGEGAATSKLFEILDNNPEFAKTLDTPAMRKRTGAKMRQDEAFGKEQGLPVRGDIQKGRKVLSEEGIEGLRKAFELDPNSFAAIMEEMERRAYG